MTSKITIKNSTDIIQKLEQEHVLAMPTDTIYGLVAKPSKTTITRIYSFKKRDRKNKPLALIVSDFKMLLQVISISERVKKMITNQPNTSITIISHGRADHPLFNLVQHHGLIGARITRAV